MSMRSQLGSRASAARRVRVLGDVWLARHRGRAPRYLPFVLPFLTWRCNLRCQACGVHEYLGETVQRELGTAEWKGMIDAAAQLGTLIFSFSGGEPLLRPDALELFAHARQRGIAVHVCTNATLIDASMARALAQAGVDTISSSLEGAEAGTHDPLRGAGSFDATVAGLQALRGHAPGIGVGVNTLVTTRNLRELERTVAFAASLGVGQIKFSPIHANLLHKDRPLREYRQLFFGSGQLEELAQRLAGARAAALGRGMQTNSARFVAGAADLYGQPRRFTCYAGYAVVAIDPTGRILPCCDFSDGPSLRDRSLLEIWRSPEFHAQRARVERCDRACWDTTNTEMSLRLSLRTLLSDPTNTWRDLRFYFARGEP
jgi:MoaA/NifB/PqqE/SkfB family radical SAM enzyme